MKDYPIEAVHTVLIDLGFEYTEIKNVNKDSESFKEAKTYEHKETDTLIVLPMKDEVDELHAKSIAKILDGRGVVQQEDFLSLLEEMSLFHHHQNHPIIEKVLYKTDGMNHDTDDNVFNLVEKTIELAKKFPFLSHQFVEHYNHTYVVFSHTPIPYEEAHEFVTKKKFIYNELKNLFTSLDDKTKKELKVYYNIPDTFRLNTIKYPLTPFTLYLNSWSVEVEYEINNEYYRYSFHKEEVKDLFNA